MRYICNNSSCENFEKEIEYKWLLFKICPICRSSIAKEDLLIPKDIDGETWFVPSEEI